MPVLVGPEAKIRAAAQQRTSTSPPSSVTRPSTATPPRSAAVALARDGKVEALMKGSLHTDELMHAVVDEEKLAHGRRISHVFVIDCPDLSAAAVHHRRGDQHLSHARGQARHRAERHRPCPCARHRAAESRDPVGGRDRYDKIKSTLDAAALCKMADRGQITGGILDGPLAFDNAVSRKPPRPRASSRRSPARPTSSSCPIWKPATCWRSSSNISAERRFAGIVLGARVPDHPDQPGRQDAGAAGSCAIALLLARHNAEVKP